ncbi:DUF4244 domain-containing protein [Nocardiopsis lambiniae]|uniref:DUF4244 domain-containing protein n=1 Tax=Nocardiopsis lambiniae TaxID=3075539 RepID=UPI0037C92735
MFSSACLAALARCPFPLLPAVSRRAAPPEAERGITTTEYALCIITAVAFAGVLYAIVKSPAVNDALTGIVVNALGTGF